MSSVNVNERLQKMREEREAKQKARIEKLRELNLKKYSKLGNPSAAYTASTGSVQNQTLKPINNNIPSTSKINNQQSQVQTSQRAPLPTKKPLNNDAGVSKIKPITNINKNTIKLPQEKNIATQNKVNDNKIEKSLRQGIPKQSGNQNLNRDNVKIPVRKEVKNEDPKKVKDLRTSKILTFSQHTTNKPVLARKSMLPTTKQQESVFDRLYKPRVVQKKEIDEVEKLKTDPEYLKNVMKEASLIVNKRHTLFETKFKDSRPVRRSISAVHFKRISKSEINNCIHKWASIGDNINKVHVENISEDNEIDEDKVVLAVKSERKRVKFQTPCHNYNTPRPQELQARLKDWLQKRGKALDSFHHLQCFGLDHPPVKPLNLDVTMNDNEKVSDVISEGDKAMDFNIDEENKENIALESDSDDESYIENMSNVPSEKNCPLKPDPELPVNGWRRASLISESVDFNETGNTTLTAGDTSNNLEDVLLGALNDLTELLKEGFEWDQCARWLRAIRERFPQAPNTAAYWECRAQLEESRGDLPASVQCWEEAIVKGTQHSVVEASLDQLLDKFMQLKISPNSGKRQHVNPKLVDVKNVFKSTIIRFAVQQAKLRKSEGPKYTVTPVRRSARLSTHWSEKRTPLQVCSSVRQADEYLGQKLLFVPNDTLCDTP